MKKLCFLTAFLAVLLSFAAEEPVVNIWSGREVKLPYKGVWRLLAPHGRVIASGEGSVILNLPPLEDGTHIDGELHIDGKSPRKIRAYSPGILSGVSFTSNNDMPKGMFQKLNEYGAGLLGGPPLEHPESVCIAGAWPKSFTSRLTLIFPDKLDFPLRIPDSWEEITLLRTKNPGVLSVLLDKKEQTVDVRGTHTLIKMKRGDIHAVLFTPAFDMDDIDNIVFIKGLIAEKEPVRHKSMEPTTK